MKNYLCFSIAGFWRTNTATHVSRRDCKQEVEPISLVLNENPWWIRNTFEQTVAYPQLTCDFVNEVPPSVTMGETRRVFMCEAFDRSLGVHRCEREVHDRADDARAYVLALHSKSAESSRLPELRTAPWKPPKAMTVSRRLLAREDRRHSSISFLLGDALA